ncbi:glycosyltransferase family 4 protein [Roseivirga sp. E12]|uniref:glycosyltransferase family 4 protein n=1 Tax=Roseivirga sp. E12 TaxID=2819237 RepID=UPI001ABCC3C6|nr:glycosyltransferase family 4 protein [Roseivirga sp. E12]MBO3698372.1 glycosyltransferase family 4 protein [Roseivirga sp. E12]
MRLQKLLVWIFNVRTFKTMRNVIDDKSLDIALAELRKATKGDINAGYDFVDHVYSMTPFMANHNKKHWGINSQRNLLLPPNDFTSFQKKSRVRHVLENAIFIGNDWKRKGLSDYIALANAFPELTFHVVGKGNEKLYKNEIKYDNVEFHGLLIESQLLELVIKADLHILPSHSEGLPRVWLETLANGLPSILYSGYGMEDFVKNGKTGFVLNEFLDLKNLTRSILTDEVSLEELSKNCIEESINYHPKKLTSSYEEAIQDLYYE